MNSSTFPTPERTSKPDPREVAVAAYHLYAERGFEDGHDVEDWLRAEELLAQSPAERVEREKRTPSTPLATEKSLRSADARENPLARDERGSSTREEIRRQTTPFRPAARQPAGRPNKS